MLSQCVFDGSQRFSFVLQVLLQLPKGVVPLLSVKKDLLKPQKEKHVRTVVEFFYTEFR